MPGKVNPVIPEAVTQVAMLVMGYDHTIALAAASGNLELNPFLPLIAHCLLDSCHLLSHGCDIMRRFCVEGIVADEERCREHVEGSTATATALVPVIGYENATRLAKLASERRKSLKETAITEGMLTAQQFEERVSPEAVCRLGSPLVRREERS
jgi:aspartate ammonia-lyase